MTAKIVSSCNATNGKRGTVAGSTMNTSEAKAHARLGGVAVIPQRYWGYQYRLTASAAGSIVCEALYNGAHERFCEPPEANDWEAL